MNEYTDELQLEEAAEAEQFDQALGSQAQEETDTERMLFKDYTQKTQSLAAERRELEIQREQLQSQADILAQIEAARNDPGEFKQLMATLQEIGSQNFGDDFLKSDGYDDPDYTTGERDIKAELREVKRQLAQLTTINKSQIEAQKNLLAAQNAASVFKEETGIVVTPEQVAKAVKETGLTNPIHALKVANFGKTQAPAPSKKPASPSQKDAEELVVNEATTFEQIMTAREKGIPIRD